MKCKDCLYLIRYFNGKNKIVYYECHRFPPVTIPLKTNNPALLDLHTYFPRIKEDDYCFEFKKFKKK